MDNKTTITPHPCAANYSIANADDLLIEHVMPFITKLPRNKPCVAEQMFDAVVWKVAPITYGQRVSFLAKSGRLPLVHNGKLGNNAQSYLITLP